MSSDIWAHNDWHEELGKACYGLGNNQKDDF